MKKIRREASLPPSPLELLTLSPRTEDFPRPLNSIPFSLGCRPRRGIPIGERVPYCLSSDAFSDKRASAPSSRDNVPYLTPVEGLSMYRFFNPPRNLLAQKRNKGQSRDLRYLPNLLLVAAFFVLSRFSPPSPAFGLSPQYFAVFYRWRTRCSSKRPLSASFFSQAFWIAGAC